MQTYSARFQEKDQSAAKAVSYKQQRGSQTACQLIDNRPEAVSQRKLQTIANKHSANEVFQLRATKYITAHARSHYHDGWGAAYGISDDPALRAAVPNAVTGRGSIDLGEHDAPEVEQITPGRIKSKRCSIGYEDNRYHNETRIFACGPLGPVQWRNA